MNTLTQQLGGNIQMIIGPMWGSKTSELLRRFRIYKLRKMRCCIIKHIDDNRYCQDGIHTHDKFSTYDNVLCSGSNILHMIEEVLKDFDVVCVDEGQFFTNLVQFCEILANVGHIVIVAGLSGDHNQQKFGEIQDLIPKADSITHTTAICVHDGCTNSAAFTFKNGNTETQKQVGGADLYKPLCRVHYNKYTIVSSGNGSGNGSCEK